MKTINIKRHKTNTKILTLLILLYLSYAEIAFSAPPSSFEAPPWKPLIKYDAENSYSRTIFVNDNFKFKSNSISEVWQLVSFDEGQSINGATVYGSQLELWGYECNLKRQRLIYFRRFNNTMGGGLVLDDADLNFPWKDLEAWKIKEFNYACKSKSDPLSKPKAVNETHNAVQKLEALNSMLKKGLITQDEYNIQKNKILNSM